MRYRQLTQSGDYWFGHALGQFLVNSPAAVAQAIKTSLGLFQKEWFLDATVGVPYMTQVLGAGTQPLYDSALKSAVLGVQGVQSIDVYTSNLNTTTRALVVNMTVTTIYGKVNIVGAFGPQPDQFGILGVNFVAGQSLLG